MSTREADPAKAAVWSECCNALAWALDPANGAPADPLDCLAYVAKHNPYAPPTSSEPASPRARQTPPLGEEAT